jgi:3-methyladenine DNA glycosylase AlkD
MVTQLHKDVKLLANQQKAEVLSRFFKTNKGEYGEGDIFVGLTVPQSRIIAKTYKDLSLYELTELIKSLIHEERLIALIIAVNNYKKASVEDKTHIYTWYVKHTKWINNWDLVDLSAEHIVGEYVWSNKTNVLLTFAHSSSLWERRIAIISTFYFIKRGISNETLSIAILLLKDSHDLIHKAVGWMLREVGKRCGQDILEQFLDTYAGEMPRTMLRYAIEKLSQEKRVYYLNKKI